MPIKVLGEDRLIHKASAGFCTWSSGENAYFIYALYWMVPIVVWVEEVHILSMQSRYVFLGGGPIG
jgi:hypothetical protein